VGGLIRDGNAPLDGGPADGDVLKALLDESNDLVAARFRADEFRMVLVKLEQTFLERRELEIEILFGDCFGGSSTIRARVARLGVGDV